MTGKIFFKLVGAVLCLLVVALLAVDVLATRVIETTYQETLEREVLDKASMLARTLAEGVNLEAHENAREFAHRARGRVTLIARVLNQATNFNEVVREQIKAMEIGQRYETITEAFNSIRDDARGMVAQMEDGRISTMERLSNIWQKAPRGDIATRFNKIRDTYLEVSKDSSKVQNNLFPGFTSRTYVICCSALPGGYALRSILVTPSGMVTTKAAVSPG